MNPESKRPVSRTLGAVRQLRAAYPVVWGRQVWKRGDGVVVANTLAGIPTPVNLLDRVFRSGSARNAND
ncbi:MAG: hypothetical protein HZA81_00625 [Candidatus Taylorbacteria bacterium]|nr:hypothetical protein [Candidatus Taylorbacteria bacterium]